MPTFLCSAACADGVSDISGYGHSDFIKTSNTSYSPVETTPQGVTEGDIQA